MGAPDWVNVFPIEHEDIPASYVSLPECIPYVYRSHLLNHLRCCGWNLQYRHSMCIETSNVSNKKHSTALVWPPAHKNKQNTQHYDSQTLTARLPLKAMMLGKGSNYTFPFGFSVTFQGFLLSKPSGANHQPPIQGTVMSMSSLTQKILKTHQIKVPP